MKRVPLTLLSVFALFVISCSGSTEHHYYKCFYIAETSFDIEGEIFVNDELTEKGNFERISVKVDSVRNWEIEGVKKTGNKFTLSVDTIANGITLSKDSIASSQNNIFQSFDNQNNINYLYPQFPDDFLYCSLIFYVDGRRAKGAISSEFDGIYYYVYILEEIDLSETTYNESDAVFGGINQYYYYYNLNFSQPGWYKIFYSKNKKIGDKAAYSSGGNTKIRSPK